MAGLARAAFLVAKNPKVAGVTKKAGSFVTENPQIVDAAMGAVSQLQGTQPAYGQGIQTPTMGFPQATYSPIQSGYIPPPSQVPMDYYYQSQPIPAFYMPSQAGPVSEEVASSGFSFLALFYSFGSAFLPFIWVFLQPTILPFMFGQIILFGGITLGLKYMANWEWRNSAIAGWLVQGIIFFFIYYFINRNVFRALIG